MTICQVYAVLSQFLARDRNIRKTNNLNQHKTGCSAMVLFPEHLKALIQKTLPYLMLDFLIHTLLTSRTRQTKNDCVH